MRVGVFLLAVGLMCEARAADHPCEGLEIAALRLEGCSGYWCDAPGERGKLLSLTDVQRGTPWREVELSRARRRFEATGLFRAVEDHCQLRDDGRVNVLVRVFPNRWIRRIEFEGNGALFDSDLLKRMTLRPGVAFNDDEVSAEQRARQEDALQRRYAKEGFDDARVTITTTEVGADGVDLRVLVDEGDKRKVSAIDVNIERRISDAIASPFGTDFKCPTFSARDIRKASELSGGDAFTSRRQRQARSAVVTYLRSYGIIEPEVDVTYDEARRRTRIDVRFHRCYALRFLQRQDEAPGREGFGPADEDELIGVLTFGESGAFDFDEAELGRFELEAHFQQQGYLFADVVLDYRDAPSLSRDSQGVHGVISYYITRAYQSEIRAITLRGNEHLDEEALTEVMKTRTYDFFDTGGFLLVDQMLGDLVAIRERYRQQGYYAMRYPEALKVGTGDPPRVMVERTRDVESGDDLYDYYFADLHFRLRKHPLESVIYLEVTIDEGPRAMTGEVRVEREFTDLLADLRTRLETQPGTPWSAAEMSRDLAVIEEFFQQRGHHQLQIEVQCTAWEGRALAQTCGKDRKLPCTPEQCNWRTVGAGRVDIDLRFKPGPAIRVGEIFVRGNAQTDSDLIVEGLPRPGEPLNRLKLDEAEREIRALGVFSNVEVRLVGLDETPIRERVAIVVQVQERRSKLVEVAIGVETLVQRANEVGVPAVASGLSGSIGLGDSLVMGQTQSTPLNVPNFLTFFGLAYRDLNFAGRAIELEIPLKYGISLPENVEDSESWADAFTRFVELRPTLYEPRLGGTNVSLSASIFARYDRATLNVDEFETGATVGLGFTPFERLRTTLTVTASGIKVGEVCDIGEDCTSGELPQIFSKPDDFPESKTFRPLDPKIDIDLNATLDFLDNPIHPSEGFAIGARLNYLLSSASTEPDERIESRVLGNFIKWELNARAAFSIRKLLIVAMFFRYADSVSFGDADRLPVEERYRLGGVYGIRGLADESVRPVDANGDPIGGVPGGDSLLMGTAELRVPLLQRAFGELWLGLFVDYGGLAEAPDEFVPESIRWTAGVGIRLLISGIAVRFDVGFNPDPRCKVRDDGSPIRRDDGSCANDTEEVAQTHFGLLYTF